MMVCARNVGKTYDVGRPVLNNVSFLIEKGEFVFLVGASGAGKSTLIKMFLRETLPTEGDFTVNGVDVSTIEEKEIPMFRRTIGVVFQDFRLLDDRTVYENVEFAMIIVGASRSQRRKRVPDVLNMVGLADRANAYPDQLSGGE
jgi:cell division transport system ATP-binding protein